MTWKLLMLSFHLNIRICSWCVVNADCPIFWDRNYFVSLRIVFDSPNLKSHNVIEDIPLIQFLLESSINTLKSRTMVYFLNVDCTLTWSVCMVSVLMQDRSFKSHTFTVWSEELDTKWFLSGENATLRTHDAWPDTVPRALACWL